MPDYRYRAREALRCAREHLDSNEDNRKVYAALELRLALEFLTYDRAYAYKEFIPPEETRTWQAQKLMGVLLEIDPQADASCELAVAPEVSPGKVAPGTPYKKIGAERSIKFAELQDHYNALGSFLHAPTIRLVENPKPDRIEKLTSRCFQVAEIIEEVLASTIHNVVIGHVAAIDCVRCENPIKRRLAFGQNESAAKCFNCPAEYEITLNDDNSTTWKPKQQELDCTNPDCKQSFFLWHDLVKDGSVWTCECGWKNRISLVVAGQEPMSD